MDNGQVARCRDLLLGRSPGETRLVGSLPIVLAIVVGGWLLGVLIANAVPWLRRLFTPRREMREDVDKAARSAFEVTTIAGVEASLVAVNRLLHAGAMTVAEFAETVEEHQQPVAGQKLAGENCGLEGRVRRSHRLGKRRLKPRGRSRESPQRDEDRNSVLGKPEGLGSAFRIGGSENEVLEQGRLAAAGIAQDGEPRQIVLPCQG